MKLRQFMGELFRLLAAGIGKSLIFNRCFWERKSFINWIDSGRIGGRAKSVHKSVDIEVLKSFYANTVECWRSVCWSPVFVGNDYLSCVFLVWLATKRLQIFCSMSSSPLHLHSTLALECTWLLNIPPHRWNTWIFKYQKYLHFKPSIY